MSNLNQGKRGPKPYTPDSKHRLMPIPMIAASIGCSERTVQYDLHRGVAKMQLALCRLLLEVQ